MSRVNIGRLGREPTSEQLAAQLDHVVQVLNQEIEFGDPADPNDPTSATIKAGATATTGAHNGTLANISGSWVEISLTATGNTDATCYHNLYLSSPQYAVPVTGEPNCRWQVHGIMHDGTACCAVPPKTIRFVIEMSYQISAA